MALSLIADVLKRGDRLTTSRLDNEPEVFGCCSRCSYGEVRAGSIVSRCIPACRRGRRPNRARRRARTAGRADVFEWLAHLPFVEHGPYGLFPHDLARDVVYMDFRWRDPDAAFRVTERVLEYLYERLDRTHGLERQRVWFDVLYVQRYNPGLRPYFEWAGFGTAYAEAANAREHAAIVDMVERYEGPRQQQLHATGWRASQRHFARFAAWGAT